MRMVDLISKTRAGGALTREEIGFIVNGFTAGDIPDYQMSAWMMAVCFNGMTKEETGELTMAMTASGDTVDLSALPGIKVDKHSTGGVGDTTTLVVAPLVAACGGTVAKMSGRGLGHTGGTLDKLEAIPGLSVNQSEERFKNIVRENGLCITGQTKNLVPADKLMYSLRDVTGTVSSIPLIASSIMSKKLAAGADAIVLDVKMGSGAFMRSIDEAEKLARTMVDIGDHVGRRVIAVITDMNQPLGMAVGNSLEVKEAVDVLSGMVRESDPLYRVCILLASKMLILSKLASSDGEAAEMLKNAIKSGAGLRRLELMASAMGGDASYLSSPERLCNARKRIAVTAEKSGFIGDMRVSDIGVAAQLLGAGRARKDDVIDPAVGLVMEKRRGDAVTEGESIATLYVNDDRRAKEAYALLSSAVTITGSEPEALPTVYEIIE